MDARIVSNQVVNSLQVSILRDVPPGDFIPGLNFLIKNISDEDVEATIIPVKSWFGDDIEQRIIESAIIFWFKDVDCKAENKVVEYLREY